MTTCPHCHYSGPGNWQVCPNCAQRLPDAASPPPAGGPPRAANYPPTAGSYPPGYPPGAASYPPGAVSYPPPGAASYSLPGNPNPYAAPTANQSQPVAFNYGYPYESLLPTSGKAIASMVLGIISIVIYPLGIILGPLAIAFWSSARGDLNQNPPAYKGRGLSIAGLTTGIIGTVIGLLMVAMIGFAICAAEKARRGEPF